ncbi:MAG: hypothetical protein ABJQ21_00645 [Roseibium sp.]
MPTKAPISLSTLGELATAGYAIFGHCLHPHCGRSRELDLDAMIAKFGPDYEVINETRIASALVCQSATCPRKGLRGGQITLHPPT